MVARARIEKLIKWYKEFIQMMDYASVIGLTSETELGEHIYKMIDMHMEAIEDIIGDSERWLSWYITDNECGSKGLAVKINGDIKAVDSIDILLEVINS